MLNLKLPNGQYYIPTNTGAPGTNVFITSPAIYHEHQLITNLDYLINSRNTFTAKYFYTQDPQIAPFNGTDLPGTPVSNYYANTNASLKLTTLITNSLVNEAIVSGQRNNAIGTDTTPGTPQGVGQTPIVPSETELPLTHHRAGRSACSELWHQMSARPTRSQIADQISWSRGKHTIRAGFSVEGTRWPISFMGLERGFLLYRSFSDWLIGRGGCSDPSCSGNPTTMVRPLAISNNACSAYAAGRPGLFTTTQNTTIALSYKTTIR